jgi:hypothetical protein
MVHLTLAVGDFMLMLIGSALWVGLGFAAVAAVCFGAFGGLFAVFRKYRGGR